MITGSFDPNGAEIIRAEYAIPQKAKEIAARFSVGTVIITFSGQLMDALRDRGTVEPLDSALSVGSAAFKSNICRVKNSDIAVVLSGIGAPSVAAVIEELFALFGVRNFVVFGSGGALTDIPAGCLIVPEKACRDEGTSYHYAEPSDYIAIKNAGKISRILEEIGIGHISGGTWTTDAFYRETVGNRARRVAEGCVCVEMECSAAQAVCDLRGLELYQFIYAADSLDGEWSRRILGELESDSRLKYFAVAYEIAKRVMGE